MQWDVFISHASEDKESFVRSLALKLQECGLRVWYDEFSLKLGDSLNRSINTGLAESQFGIVVLSDNFFDKEWPRRELDGLVAREISEGKVILPLWHGVNQLKVKNTLGSGHHQKTFEAVKAALGKPGEPLADYFETCRRKRNLIDYDASEVVTDTEAEELLEKAKEFQEMVGEWIVKHHPTFKA